MIRLHMKNADVKTLDFQRITSESSNMAETETEDYRYIIRYQRNGIIIARVKKKKWWRYGPYLTVNDYLGVTKLEFFEFGILVGDYIFKKYVMLDKEGKISGTIDVPI